MEGDKNLCLVAVWNESKTFAAIGQAATIVEEAEEQTKENSVSETNKI